MFKHVRFDKRQKVVDELVRRIASGTLKKGHPLPGEHRLAAEFSVSRGTLREALSELKRRNYIATQAGVGSIVSYDGTPLNQKSGWTRALAESGMVLQTELLSLAPVVRSDLTEQTGCTHYIEALRRRIAPKNTVVSLERALLPACDGLERLPEIGLRNDSVTDSLAACGFVGAFGTQWAEAAPLAPENAALMGREPGTFFLRVVRLTFDRRRRFTEWVESLLDPAHFRLVAAFGENP